MMTVSILLKAYALVFWPINGLTALGCWAGSVLLDFYWLRGRSRRFSLPSRTASTDLALLNVSTLAIGFALRAAFFEATLRWKSGFAPVAKVIEWLFALLKFPTGTFQGRLYASTMVGSTSYPVNLDTLGLLLPLLVCAMGCVYLLLCAPSWRVVAKGFAWLVMTLVPAVLLRWMFATALFLGLCDFVNYETQDLPIKPFFKPGFIAVLYLPFLAVVATVLHRPLTRCTTSEPAASRSAPRRYLLAWAALAVLLGVIFWEPAGTPKKGTVLINTYHTAWSRTDRPYDREWYGAASGYNYACLKRLYEGFYNVRELTGRITVEDLASASVLVIYVPNRSFTDEEIQAIRQFVARGGGLFVIGDHTNVFGSSSHLNQVLEGMGFRFRDDVLFDLDADFFQLKDVSPLHPSQLHGVTFFKFRGPASIRSTSLFSRNLFTLGNAKSLRAIYSVNNFYPPPHDHPKMWTGDFAVSMTSRYGRGRVVGFADSTVFSNFEIFYPGKYEYLLNVVDWLNHADFPLLLPLKRLCLLAVLVLLGFLIYRGSRPRPALVTLATACLMAMAVWMAARLADQAQADFPKPAKPMRFLFFAAEPEDEALTLRSFVTETPYEQKYDVFIQWVLRDNIFSGFYLHGKRFDNALAGMLRDNDKADTGLALIATRAEHLALLDTLTPGPVTKADRLLLMFSKAFSWEQVEARVSRVLSGSGLAEAKAAWPDGVARIEEGKRRIAVVFQAERFSDRQMGFSEKITPNEAQRALYTDQFKLLDWLFGATEARVERNAAPVDTKN